MIFKRLAAAACLSVFICSVSALAKDSTQDNARYWIKINAKDKFERTRIANTGVSIEVSRDDYVVAIGTLAQRKELAKIAKISASYELKGEVFEFPAKDTDFHDYAELNAALTALVNAHPTIAVMDSIGRSVEGREIMRVRISGDVAKSPAVADSKPGIVFMGGHHAREHVSIEMPLFLVRHLLENYEKDAEVRRLVDGRDIHIIPVVNPDGAEHDIDGGDYKMWRKNRAQNSDGTFGVDLNRNYSYGWGGDGASPSPSSETYRGPSAFSEPESRAIRDFVERQTNLTTLLSFHTFSELILYPWGGSYDPITDSTDRDTFKKMAETMAKWNGYTPQQSSDLYVATGDTCDWAYGTHKIFAFTFELDPANWWDGGFYPGQAKLPSILQKNLKPSLYLIDLADNPRRVLKPASDAYGLRSPLF